MSMVRDGELRMRTSGLHDFRNHVGLMSVMALVGLDLSAQEAVITALKPDGRLDYRQPFARASLTVETNLTLGRADWLPMKHLLTTDQTGTVTLPIGSASATFYRLLVADTADVPAGMALVPQGAFLMGDPYLEGFPNARPAHVVRVSSFYIDRFEVTNEQARQVFQWAFDRELVGANQSVVTNREGDVRVLIQLEGNDHGIPFTHLRFREGTFSVADGREHHPVSGVTWYGAQAFCNYRSDMEGLTRCITFTNRVNIWLSAWECDFAASGYRLPTEAEWEKAARGGLTAHHFPWESYLGSAGDHLDLGRAHYGAYGSTQPVGYYNGEQVVPGIPEGSDMANGYGLYDMAGNVWEWVWDFYKADWYTLPEASGRDVAGPPGPFMGSQFLQQRVIRGGSVGYLNPIYLTCAGRHSTGWGPDYANWVVGFRCARSK